MLDVLRHPINAIRRWIAARTQRLPGPVSIRRDRIYIVPTRYGYGFALLLLVLLLGAMNYSNSMVFALCFWLAGVGLVGMHQTHANLLNLRLKRGRSAPVFAGEVATVEIRLDHPSRGTHYTVSLGWPEQVPSAWVDVPAATEVTAHLPQQTLQRGLLPAPRFVVATEYPLGLLHAWTYVELDIQTLVYPAARDHGCLPPQASGTQGLHPRESAGVEDFIGLRAYAAGDSPRSVHWKSLAHSDTPQVKRFGESTGRERVLSFAGLTGLDIEARLEQLCHWVLDAEAAQQPYTLELPDHRLGPALGSQHRDACLSALALFGRPEPAAWRA